jgi:hypothetical protein
MSINMCYANGYRYIPEPHINKVFRSPDAVKTFGMESLRAGVKTGAWFSESQSKILIKAKGNWLLPDASIHAWHKFFER